MRVGTPLTPAAGGQQQKSKSHLLARDYNKQLEDILAELETVLLKHRCQAQLSSLP